MLNKNQPIIKKVPLNKSVVLHPKMLTSNMYKNIVQLLTQQVDNRLVDGGIVQSNTIAVTSIGEGRVIPMSLNGSVKFDVQYTATLFTPVIHEVYQCMMVSKNDFATVMRPAMINGMRLRLNIYVLRQSSKLNNVIDPITCTPHATYNIKMSCFTRDYTKNIIVAIGEIVFEQPTYTEIVEVIIPDDTPASLIESQNADDPIINETLSLIEGARMVDVADGGSDADEDVAAAESGEDDLDEDMDVEDGLSAAGSEASVDEGAVDGLEDDDDIALEGGDDVKDDADGFPSDDDVF